MSGVVIRTANYGDPRFSDPQVRALVAAAGADPEALLLGLDMKLRPVVKAKLGIPRHETVYAVMRNGDPAQPAFKPGTSAGLHEYWVNK